MSQPTRKQRNFDISFRFGLIGKSRLSSSGIFPITISYACCRAHVGLLTAFLLTQNKQVCESTACLCVLVSIRVSFTAREHTDRF
jgi:hypothetical protein